MARWLALFKNMLPTISSALGTLCPGPASILTDKTL